MNVFLDQRVVVLKGVKDSSCRPYVKVASFFLSPVRSKKSLALKATRQADTPLAEKTAY
jgi:hypothetical protein